MADLSEMDERTSEEAATGGSPRPLASKSPSSSRSANSNTNPTPRDQDGTVGGGADSSCGPSPRKIRAPRSRHTAMEGATRAGADNQSTDTKSSVMSGDSYAGGGGGGGSVTISPKHKDPDRIRKDREREERVRQTRERLEQERRRKLVDLQQQQLQAQENRERQLTLRRRRIEDLRRREVERRAEVEKRRRQRENAERSRRETLLLKAEERVARYEAWKRCGHKGPPPGGTVAPGVAKPLSASTSALYPKRSFDSSGALHVSSRPDSMLAPSGLPPTRPKSVVTLNVTTNSSLSPGGAGGSVRLRENRPPSSKPRPASVGASMPSFLTLEKAKASSMSSSFSSRAASSSRSKSSDRLARERSRHRPPPTNSSTSSSSTSTPGRAEDKEKGNGKGGAGEERGGGGGAKMSRHTLDRLSTPRQVASVLNDRDQSTQPATPSNHQQQQQQRREPVARKPTNRDKTPRETPPRSQRTPHAAGSTAKTSTTATVTSHHTRVRMVSPTHDADEDGGSTLPATRLVVGKTPGVAEEVEKNPDEEEKTHGVGEKTLGVVVVAVVEKGPGGGGEKACGDLSAEEYKARLAEKRRQAREKAEREAEEGRKRREELAREEEERRQQEEEDHCRQEEEAHREAQAARRAEEERLQRAIEAEEARRAQELVRLEQERIMKEEAERKAKEDAERLELEKQEKARREEEERQERKKRLEMIMKRVKTESPSEGKEGGLSKSVTSSPAKSVGSAASSDTSPTDPDNHKTLHAMALAQPDLTSTSGHVHPPSTNHIVSEVATLDAHLEEEPVGSPSPEPRPVWANDSPRNESSAGNPPNTDSGAAVVVEGGGSGGGWEQGSPPLSTSPVPPPHSPEGEKPKFRSPMLQKLVEGKEDGSVSGGNGGPRFKSPLLQNLLGKTKLRSSLDQGVVVEGMGRRGEGEGGERVSTVSPTPNGVPGPETAGGVVVEGGSRKEVVNIERSHRDEEKDVNTSSQRSSPPPSSSSSPLPPSPTFPSHPSPTSTPHVANGNQDVEAPWAATVEEKEKEKEGGDDGEAIMDSGVNLVSGGDGNDNRGGGEEGEGEEQPAENFSPREFSPSAVLAASGEGPSMWRGEDSGVVVEEEVLPPSGVHPPSSPTLLHYPSSLQSSVNGHHGPLSGTAALPGREMEDSSLGLSTVDSLISQSAFTDSTADSGLFSSSSTTLPPYTPTAHPPATEVPDTDFEEVINLPAATHLAKTSPSLPNLPMPIAEDDVVNLNGGRLQEGLTLQQQQAQIIQNLSSATSPAATDAAATTAPQHPPQSPVIAFEFEERRQDLPDLLS